MIHNKTLTLFSAISIGILILIGVSQRSCKAKSVTTVNIKEKTLSQESHAHIILIDSGSTTCSTTIADEYSYFARLRNTRQGEALLESIAQGNQSASPLRRFQNGNLLLLILVRNERNPPITANFLVSNELHAFFGELPGINKTFDLNTAKRILFRLAIVEDRLVLTPSQVEFSRESSVQKTTKRMRQGIQ